ncbi:MAG TPA: iron-sulfur cluster repair di-iron protein [Lacunisphaera sp.]|nr:iron-sulfur cluster repair di-iron protein [Lacunisphaera sp.]
MDTLIPLEITPETRVGDIVAACPGLARLFEELRIDYCCGGKQTLAAACASRGLAPATVVAQLEATAAALQAGPAEVDPARMSLTELADHIESTHHAYLKDELPRLVEMAGRVAAKHGHRDGRLLEVDVTVRALAEEMLCHMNKEELILFPLVRQIDAGHLGGLAGSIADPIHQMEAEHDDAGRAIERLRQLTGGFVPASDDCNTHRALLDGLARFEADLHRHVHKENNVLFPRALTLVLDGR